MTRWIGTSLLPRAVRSGIVLLVLISLVSLMPIASTGAAEFGPAPRDEAGRFANPSGPLSHGSFGVRFPFFLRFTVAAFASREVALERIANDGAFLRENARHSVPTVTWVGHATLLVQMDHVSFLTDPIWSERASPVSFAGPRRFLPPGLRLEDLPPIDFVVVSHSHYDHLDLPTLVALSERDPETRFLVPLENGELLREQGIRNVEELDWGESRVHDGVTVHCLPSQHWSQRGATDRDRALWASWAVVGPERRFYFAGDTGFFDGFMRIGETLGPFDLVAVPIGAYEPSKMMRESHMNPEEAAQASIDLRARRGIGIHFGTFHLSDEPQDEPPRRFREAFAAGPLGEQGGWVLKIGETREF